MTLKQELQELVTQNMNDPASVSHILNSMACPDKILKTFMSSGEPEEAAIAALTLLQKSAYGVLDEPLDDVTKETSIFAKIDWTLLPANQMNDVITSLRMPARDEILHTWQPLPQALQKLYKDRLENDLVPAAHDVQSAEAELKTCQEKYDRLKSKPSLFVSNQDIYKADNALYHAQRELESANYTYQLLKQKIAALEDSHTPQTFQDHSNQHAIDVEIVASNHRTKEVFTELNTLAQQTGQFSKHDLQQIPELSNFDQLVDCAAGRTDSQSRIWEWDDAYHGTEDVWQVRAILTHEGTSTELLNETIERMMERFRNDEKTYVGGYIKSTAICLANAALHNPNADSKTLDIVTNAFIGRINIDEQKLISDTGKQYDLDNLYIPEYSNPETTIHGTSSGSFSPTQILLDVLKDERCSDELRQTISDQFASRSTLIATELYQQTQDENIKQYALLDNDIQQMVDDIQYACSHEDMFLHDLNTYVTAARMLKDDSIAPDQAKAVYDNQQHALENICNTIRAGEHRADEINELISLTDADSADQLKTLEHIIDEKLQAPEKNIQH